MEAIIDSTPYAVLALVEVLVVIAAAYGLSALAQRRYAERTAMHTRLQIIQAALVVGALIVIVVIAPIGDSRRGQLLSFLGIVISAAVALSSTTVLGNAMAGLMLRSIRAFKPGDYMVVGDYAGRVTEMDLLHVEIQTEESDLMTLSNVHLITHPFRVIRTEEGTILSVHVSLGYDVPHDRAEELLTEAIEAAGLEKPFVHVVSLGDFSITYQASGLLKPAKGIIGKRSQLRRAALDALHGGGVEIVSPNFMNTRALGDARIVPKVARQRPAEEDAVSPDEVVFDKAEEAETLESLRQRHAAVKAKLAAAQTLLKDTSDEEQKTAIATQVEQLTRAEERLARLVAARETRLVGDK